MKRIQKFNIGISSRFYLVNTLIDNTNRRFLYYDRNNTKMYKNNFMLLKIDSSLSEEELFQAELINDTGISVYAIVELHKNLLNNIYDSNCVITIEY